MNLKVNRVQQEADDTHGQSPPKHGQDAVIPILTNTLLLLCCCGQLPSLLKSCTQHKCMMMAMKSPRDGWSELPYPAVLRTVPTRIYQYEVVF